jgi:hypothetical protein
MSLGDSILQTASIARWISVAGTATDHTIFDSEAQAGSGDGVFDSPVMITGTHPLFAKYAKRGWGNHGDSDLAPCPYAWGAQSAKSSGPNI